MKINLAVRATKWQTKPQTYALALTFKHCFMDYYNIIVYSGFYWILMDYDYNMDYDGSESLQMWALVFSSSSFAMANKVIVGLKTMNCIIIPACLKYADNILYGYAKPLSIAPRLA